MATIQNRRPLRRAQGRLLGFSALAGIVGGIFMGMYEMIATWAQGQGFWMPMNMIGATVPAFRPPAPDFALGPTLAGMMIHLATSALWGLVLGYAVARAPELVRGVGRAIATGLGLGLLAYFVTGLLIGPAVDPTLRAADPVHYFVGHLVYGVAATLALRLLARSRGREPSVIFAPEEAPALRR